MALARRTRPLFARTEARGHAAALAHHAGRQPRHGPRRAQRFQPITAATRRFHPLQVKCAPMANLALFDLDHTLIPTDSDHEWGRFMVKLGMVDAENFARQNDAFYADYKAGKLDIHAYLHRHAHAAREVLARATGRLARAVHARSDQADHRAGRARTRARASGSRRSVLPRHRHQRVHHGADRRGVRHRDADRVRSRNRRRSSATARTPAGRPARRAIARARSSVPRHGSRRWARTWSDFEHSYFYSDSHNDIPLLEKVTDPIATNPDDTLRAHAQAHGWRILELFQPT